MPTKLERLLESIDPERTLNDVSRRADQAVNSFHASGSIRTGQTLRKRSGNSIAMLKIPF